ncbi:TonB-dependent receptor [Gaoshiqia sediminis]|uniref:TonB-dependent receptor n=1 Tax=Gaoshiqia sediminis TaxID=2986998 RepID=A0AA41Y7V9_9BACT|nr:TonB-dependent receptor [Gaoshiqia sediminis]MCW0483480.1 TonB-dependent receptor [Gaoshiqia sediminis]
MKQVVRLTFAFILMCVSIGVAAQHASIQGRIFDASSNQGLPFVNVVVAGTTIGTVSDEDGTYRITGLPTGFVRLQVSYIGYRDVISSEVEISNLKPANLDVALEKSNTQLQEITVTASLFRKTEESPLSLKNIGISEIENSPGANRDISKVIQSFPGVQSTPSFRNDIIIRGGGPSESRFFLDGVEVPNINHFATQGASGGPVGIINADLLREVNYFSGAFPANRGNAMSGVFEFFQVDGNPDKFRAKTSVGASEVTATFDGPVGENTTYIVSARRSYLQLLFSLLELPFLPTFNDFQVKVKTRLDRKNEISFIGLGAIDQSVLNLDIDQPDDQQKFILASLPENDQWSYTAGLVYKHFRENGFQTIVLSRSHLSNKAVKFLDNDESSPDNRTLYYQSEEIENKLRYENTSRFGKAKINYGGSLDVVTYTNVTRNKRFYPDGILDINFDTKLHLMKWGLFGQASHRLLNDQLDLSLGVRIDAADYTSTMRSPFNQFSPRLSASYRFAANWSFNFNTGIYYQLPPYTALGFKNDGEYVNKTNGLKYIRAKHLIGGLEYQPKSNVVFTLEGFLKDYGQYPFSVKDSVSLANLGADYGVVGSEELVSVSEGRAYGLEFQTRIANSNRFNFNLSYTLVRSEFEDKSGNFTVSSWDSKHLLVLTTTKKLKRDWSVGARWRWVGGLPFTPYDLDRSSLVEAWNLNNGPFLDTGNWNSRRFDPFHQLDVRIDKAYYLNKITAKFYLDIQNLYNFKNQDRDILVRAEDVNGQFITTDNGGRYVLKQVENTSGTVLPAIGIILEF